MSRIVRRPAGEQSTGMSLIILNFHGVGPVSRIIDDRERSCWLDLDHFEAVLDLAQRQTHVQLTFDDGNASDVEIVLPALLRRGLQAAFFICSDRLDQPAFLSQAQVRELQAQGMGIGSHGVAHRSWRQLPPDQLWHEVEGSRRVLERVCGIPIDTVACPFGAYDRTVLHGLRRAGYHAVYTSDGGATARNHWLRARNTIHRSMGIDQVALLIQRGLGRWKQALTRAHQIVKRFR
jgi:peptidoglycan/xylan/chitin deacetylase (PgdA/CDA1 family)